MNPPIPTNENGMARMKIEIAQDAPFESFRESIQIARSAGKGIQSASPSHATLRRDQPDCVVSPGTAILDTPPMSNYVIELP